MSVLVECVPNFSEGKDRKIVDAIVAEAKAVEGVSILDVEIDADHHRCVLSFIAPPEAAIEASFRVAKKAKELIDLTKHKGEHPRMGALDVAPFIPVSGITIKECVTLAERLGERIAKELEVPVFLYDHAARKPERKNLAKVRKGQFEGMLKTVGTDPEREPDLGPKKMHPTAGAVGVSARNQIVNFNLNLATGDMVAGKDIAKRLRASGGGLPEVRGKEIELSERKQVQISTVITDYKTTSMTKVLAETRRLAAEHGTSVKTTEIVGLIPQEALLDFAIETLELENFDPEVQILERRLAAVGASSPAVDWRKAGVTVGRAMANTDATPGGGSAAGISGSMGCGLGRMAVGISLKSKKLDLAKKPGLEKALTGLESLQDDFDRLTTEDAASFDAFMDAMSLPKGDLERASRMQSALIHAAEVPLETVETAGAAHRLVTETLPLSGKAVASDMNCALHLLAAAARCAQENVLINLDGIKDAEKNKALRDRLETAFKPFVAEAAVKGSAA